MSSRGAVLFDLDGTVVDTVELIRESHRHAVTSVLGKDLPDDILVARVGQPLPEQMEAFDPARVPELLAAYQRWNRTNTAALIREYDGIADLLARLKRAGRPLGVVTSKRAEVVELAWAELPLRQYFDAIVTADDTSVHKPDPAPVFLALERLGSSVDDAIFVGDAPFDLQAAKAAGVRAVGVTWGFFRRDQLTTEDPEIVVDTPSELAEVLG